MYVELTTTAPINGNPGQDVAITWDKIVAGQHTPGDGIIPATPATAVVQLNTKTACHELYIHAADGTERRLGDADTVVTHLADGDKLYARLRFIDASPVVPTVKAYYDTEDADTPAPAPTTPTPAPTTPAPTTPSAS